MVDLAYTPDEVKEEQTEQTSPDVPKYPYGLSIYMDEDVLAKLGKVAGDFKVGDLVWDKDRFPQSKQKLHGVSAGPLVGDRSVDIHRQNCNHDRNGAKSLRAGKRRDCHLFNGNDGRAKRSSSAG